MGVIWTLREKYICGNSSISSVVCLCLLCVVLCYVLGCLKVLTGFHEACPCPEVSNNNRNSAGHRSSAHFSTGRGHREKSIFVGIQVLVAY